MKESRSAQEVWEKQVKPAGHSEPVGQGREQSRVASSKLAPQKLDSAGPLGASTAATMGSLSHCV